MPSERTLTISVLPERSFSIGSNDLTQLTLGTDRDSGILADGFDPIMDLDKSNGSWIVDERDGQKYLDMF